VKNFALKHPFAVSAILFLAVSIGGTIVSIGVLMMGECKPRSPSDPCDGGAMAAAAIWYVGFVGSLILGILAGISTFVILILKIKRKEEQNYK